jgi:hypothetical protein
VVTDAPDVVVATEDVDGEVEECWQDASAPIVVRGRPTEYRVGVERGGEGRRDCRAVRRYGPCGRQRRRSWS